jgi:hypothetical protein
VIVSIMTSLIWKGWGLVVTTVMGRQTPLCFEVTVAFVTIEEGFLLLMLGCNVARKNRHRVECVLAEHAHVAVSNQKVTWVP